MSRAESAVETRRGRRLSLTDDRDLPAGVEVSHHGPEAFVIRCSGCVESIVRDERPASRRCGRCGSSVGVTPVSYEGADPSFWRTNDDVDELGESIEPATPDGGYVGATDEEVRSAVESIEDDHDRDDEDVGREIEVCPVEECHSPNISRRLGKHRGGHGSVGSSYRCGDCLERFDEPHTKRTDRDRSATGGLAADIEALVERDGTPAILPGGSA